MMKKTVAALLAATMTLGMLVGCGSSETTEETVEETTADEDVAEEGMEGYITILSREDGSGTRGAFIELFGVEEKNEDGEKIDNTTEDAQITNSTSVMMTTVAGDPAAIGYISLGSLDDSVKALKVDGADATAENIKSGTYKVSRPFNIATNGDVTEVTQDFIDYIMSAEGQAIIEDNGYIAVNDAAESYAGTKPEGKIVVAGSSSVTPVMEKLKEAYLEVNTNAEIEIQQSDSTTGMESAISGICDIGMASRELKDTETAEGLVGQQIALDGIAVIVNKENTLDDISAEMVKKIYVGEVTDWADVK